LAVTLFVGVPSAYALHVQGGRLSRIVEEIITLPLAIPGLERVGSELNRKGFPNRTEHDSSSGPGGGR